MRSCVFSFAVNEKGQGRAVSCRIIMGTERRKGWKRGKRKERGLVCECEDASNPVCAQLRKEELATEMMEMITP